MIPSYKHALKQLRMLELRLKFELEKSERDLRAVRAVLAMLSPEEFYVPPVLPPLF